MSIDDAILDDELSLEGLLHKLAPGAVDPLMYLLEHGITYIHHTDKKGIEWRTWYRFDMDTSKFKKDCRYQTGVKWYKTGETDGKKYLD